MIKNNSIKTMVWRNNPYFSAFEQKSNCREVLMRLHTSTKLKKISNKQFRRTNNNEGATFILPTMKI